MLLLNQFSSDWVNGSGHLVLLPFHWILRQVNQSVILTQTATEQVTVIATGYVIEIALVPSPFYRYHGDCHGFYRCHGHGHGALVSETWIESEIDDGDV